MESQYYGWADSMPAQQGLYDPSMEKDSCGVGFIVNIKGQQSHSLVQDASSILCNMTHRGAEGADDRDGDGSGVMTGIPHRFFRQQCLNEFNVNLPPEGQYAVGNVFLSPDMKQAETMMSKFEQIASGYGLKVLCWRKVPTDNSMLGKMAASKEPTIMQPFVVMTDAFDSRKFEVKLFMLRKRASHEVSLRPWFYICSLNPRTIVYKGRLSPKQVYFYFLDITNSAYQSHFALVHSRFSTNTFPSWDRAQPMRLCAHNGEINTLKGNKNWMRAREGMMKSPLFGESIADLFPIIEEYGSDSSAFDNVFELLTVSGLSIAEAAMLMIPEAWQKSNSVQPEKAAFYQYVSAVMEPWDGPALITFSDGRHIGAILDRNGLRPCRYYLTNDDRMICASEVGTVKVDPSTVVHKGRLMPGRMLLVDTVKQQLVDDTELKSEICTQFPYGEWLQQQSLNLKSLVSNSSKLSDSVLMQNSIDSTSVQSDARLKAFGFSIEQLNMVFVPMIKDGKEPLGSMGIDVPLACLSQQPRSIYEYFRQLFAQVTNPPIDPIREEIVMSLSCFIGPEWNLLSRNAQQCDRLYIDSPILTPSQFQTITSTIPQQHPKWKVGVIDITFKKAEGLQQYKNEIDRICQYADHLVEQQNRIIILSDRNVGVDRVAVSSLVALGAVHQHLLSSRQRSKVALIVESGEAREVHHMCVLLGHGCDAIYPYLMMETIAKLKRDNVIESTDSVDKLIANYQKSLDNGILKVMSKMGISTLQSYKGAQIFEALGIDPSVMQVCFAGTPSRIRGVTFEHFAVDAFNLHDIAYPNRDDVLQSILPVSGEYHFRNSSERHINDPKSIASLQQAVKLKDVQSFEEYSRSSYEQIKDCTLRGQLEFKKDLTPIPLDEVEPWTEIVKKFCTGAMSYGSISMEAHSALAIAMNKLGAKSNTGEGGEDPERSTQDANGDLRRSAIKQVASGRFGVTSYYLSDSDEIQIKMAQGAKPGEGGELSGHKVSESIAKTRKTSVGVGLISPPPHHDIYSIEDLKQLIHDLKSCNPRARVSVKLVSEVGVGVIANGVAKAKADHILISGHDGGTGASRLTGIKYAGLPWELGLAETHQTLVLNGLRGRITLQTDGQIKTGRDVIMATLLGAEEFGFATTPLIAMGCIMMRKCHLNTCPVGIATQDPVLRAKFTGSSEDVINFFYFMAEEVRQIMAQLGFRKLNDLVGRSDLLQVRSQQKDQKSSCLDLRSLLTPAFSLRADASTHFSEPQDHMVEQRLDNKLLPQCVAALEGHGKVVINSQVLNTDRSVGAIISYNVSRKFGEQGLPDDTITINFNGSAGQSFGAFLAKGITLRIEGDTNDYVGKGLSGGKIIVRPPKNSLFDPSQSIISGNVCLYGATSGEAYFNGVAAERFCVRNSGARVVVEGVGDHGCEYMTGGICIVLGKTGRNFAAGMSGGFAYILDEDQAFSSLVNSEMVDLERLTDAADIDQVRGLIQNHYEYTNSAKAKAVLNNWKHYVQIFVKVFPRDLKKALQSQQVNKSKHSSAVIQPPALSASIKDIEDGATKITAESSDFRPDKLRGFMKYKRQTDRYIDAKERVKGFGEINKRLTTKELQVQGARCMDCGVPFCQSHTGCPIGNLIPRWNDLVYQHQWKEALERLLQTNNFPEFTGRVCPAPCEGACVLGINSDPVAIKSIECAIIDYSFDHGWMKASPPSRRSGKTIAIIGSGPAGLSAADQLNKAGHGVTVYERADRIGGLLMYGIPNMKLDKLLVDRRVNLMREEGVKFEVNAHIGYNVDAANLVRDYDAVLIATGSTVPRDLNIKNRALDGIYFAMDFLTATTQSLLNSNLKDDQYITAKGKNVIVIGGGDTGNDCIGTSVRHGAKSVINFELLPEPPGTRSIDNPWPQFPRVFKVDYGHGEVKAVYGNDPRQYCVLSKEFISDGNGKVSGIRTVRVEWTKNASTGKWIMTEVQGSERVFEADLVLLAMGFTGPEQHLLQQLKVKTDARSSNVASQNITGMSKDSSLQYKTNVPRVYSAGDCRRGQSLIVWAINEGRQAARAIDLDLMGSTYLPLTGGIVKIEKAKRETLIQGMKEYV
ncbi:hypothetical protein MP228_001294 [Amoeboaphelidium protococcarum]|nr:hypothetical protein MP228_001294 [Amoeboaphelidium protococcarum]